MKYRTIFENTGAATIIVENDMTISLANSEFVNISGFGKIEIENRKSWLQFVDEKTQRKIRGGEGVPDHFEPGQTAPYFECKFIDKDRIQKEQSPDLTKALFPWPIFPNSKMPSSKSTIRPSMTPLQICPIARCLWNI
jgi:PAS domain-containing protein